MATSILIKDVLDSSIDLTALATGGIYDFEELGREGLTMHNAPDAFDGPTIKPCIVIKSRDKIYTEDLGDENLQLKSYTQIINIFCLSYAGFGSCEILSHQVYILLADQRVPGLGRMVLAGTDEGREAEDLAGSPFIRMDFQLFGYTSP